MKRREFLAGLGAAAWPLAARAQQNATGARLAKIGVLWPEGTAQDSADSSVLVRALNDLGYVEGKTAHFFHRFPAQQSDIRASALELLDGEVDVIVAVSVVGAYEVKQLTSSVPIVFVLAADPVGTGFVQSLAHPGGNLTGLSLMSNELTLKRLSLLKEAVPALSRLTLLSDPRTPWFQSGIISHQDAAKAVGLSFRLVETTSGDAIETAFADLASGGADGVATATQPIMLRERARIGASALAHKIPTVVPFAEMVPYGSLMSYGGDFSDYPRKAAVYVDQILKGAKPADLPVEQPTRTRLVINLKTAHALGLSVPPTLLATADEVIE